MRGTILIVLAMSGLAACQGASPGLLGDDRREVHGVDEGDMLKLRGGPGIGFSIHAGLPNGAIVRVRDCSRLGGTRWCKVAMDGAPGLEGYVSETYLREL